MKLTQIIRNIDKYKDSSYSGIIFNYGHELNILLKWLKELQNFRTKKHDLNTYRVSIVNEVTKEVTSQQLVKAYSADEAKLKFMHLNNKKVLVARKLNRKR